MTVSYAYGVRVRIDLPGDPNYGRVGTIAVCDGDAYQVEGLLRPGSPYSSMPAGMWSGWYYVADLTVV